MSVDVLVAQTAPQTNWRFGVMKRTPLRTNVLALMGAGYLVVLVVFSVLVVGAKDISVEDAYKVVQGPLMALIGGSLAISKDLIPMFNGKSDDTNDDHADHSDKAA